VILPVERGGFWPTHLLHTPLI